MKTTKKLLSILLTLLLSTALILPGCRASMAYSHVETEANANSTKASLLTTDANVNGSEVTIAVNLNQNDGIASGKFAFYFDSNVLQYKDYSLGSALSNVAIDQINTGIPGKFLYVFAHYTALSQTDTCWITISFSIIDSTISSTSVTTTMEEAYLNDGGSTSVLHGASSTNNITLTPGNLTYTVIFMDWNGTVLKTQSVSEGQDATPPTSPTRTGYAFIGWDNDYNNVECDLVITALYSQSDVNTDTPQIFASNVTGKPGSIVAVDISIKNNPGIIATTVLVNYNHSVLELASAENGSVISGSDVTFVTSNSFSATPYGISIVSTAASNYTVDGILIKLTFKIKDTAPNGASSAIALSFNDDASYNVNLEPVELATVNGSVTVKAGVVGDVNGDGKVTTIDALLILRKLAGWSITLDEAAADINGDTKVTTIDALLILRHLAGWTVPYFE